MHCETDFSLMDYNEFSNNVSKGDPAVSAPQFSAHAPWCFCKTSYETTVSSPGGFIIKLVLRVITEHGQKYINCFVRHLHSAKQVCDLMLYKLTSNFFFVFYDTYRLKAYVWIQLNADFVYPFPCWFLCLLCLLILMLIILMLFLIEGRTILIVNRLGDRKLIKAYLTKTAYKILISKNCFWKFEMIYHSAGIS